MIDFSIIMPTYNSAGTIKMSLESILSQDYDQSKIEILVVDGGSTDETRQIALSYNAIIIENERRLPEFAKQIGFESAKGKYALMLDSDEMFASSNILTDVARLFEENPKLKNVLFTGAPAVEGANACSRYLCRMGDPFSNFVYHHYDGENYLKSYGRFYKTSDLGVGVKFEFSEDDTYPLSDGSFFDVEFARQLKEKYQLDDITTDVFSIMVDETGVCAFLKNGLIRHDPRVSAKTYIKKIRWRIKNNLFSDECVGYSTREKKQGHLSKRKYLFVFYCILIIPILVNSVRLTIKYKDICMLSDIYFTYATFIMIAWYMAMKALHIPVKMDKSYGKS